MRSEKVVWILGLAGIAVLGVFLVHGTRASRASAVGRNDSANGDVKIDNFSFAPAELRVTVGTTVTWTNEDDVPHTVVSEDKTTFKSHALDTGDKFAFTFAKKGKYSYFCSVHPKMTGEILVQ